MQNYSRFSVPPKRFLGFLNILFFSLNYFLSLELVMDFSEMLLL